MATLIDANQAMFTPFEPKLKNRYVMSIDGIPAYLIKSTGRPAIEFEEVELNHLNVKRFVKGKATWQSITMTMYDPVVPSAAQSVMEWVRLSHESVTGRDGYSDFYKKDVTIEVLGPVGDIVESWKLKGTWIQSANFNDLDFASSDPVDIEVTLRYDYAILEF
tara:strand:+ start:111 stop:599 length:489 start_codon:yes stop_codon:yes gene_type:complete